jgi:hypothetical protein
MPQRTRLDCESKANHNLNRWLDKPGGYIEKSFFVCEGWISRRGGKEKEISSAMIFEDDFDGTLGCYTLISAFIWTQVSCSGEIRLWQALLWGGVVYISFASGCLTCNIYPDWPVAVESLWKRSPWQPRKPGM